MKYTQWKTHFDEMREQSPHLRKLNASEIFKLAISTLIDTDSEADREYTLLESERISQDYIWESSGKPYYSIHPSIVTHLCNCELENFPSNYLEVPAGFHAVHLRFTERHPYLSVSDTEYVKSILVADVAMSKLSAIETLTFLKTGAIPESMSKAPSEIMIRLDLGERTDHAEMMDWNIAFRINVAESIGEIMAEREKFAIPKFAKGTRRSEVMENCIRLVATVGLIANCPEDNLLEYDVLAKDKQRFKSASPKRKEELIAKARRRGKIGWNVGTNELFIGEQPLGESGLSTAPKGSHSHAHIRTGHLHPVRFGKGRKQVKIKWFRPTVVRPDLPFNSGDDC